MTDIARLGFSVDTKDLTAAEQKLRAIKPAAEQAEKKARDLTSAFSGVGPAADGAGRRGTEAFRRITLSAGQMQSNFTNLGAQFQDIGVTAAAGMSPLLIGLQQGAQISAVFSQEVGGRGLGGALRGLGGAFLSILSPLSLIIIAMTSFLALGFQLIDWTGVARSALLFVADNMELLTNATLIAAGTLALIYAPTIIAGIGTLSVWIGVTLFGAIQKATWALIAFSVMNPFGAFVAGLAVAIAAALYFSDKIQQYFGVDIIGSVKSAINFIIGGMVGAYRTIVKTWDMLPAALGDAIFQTANNVIAGVEWMVNTSIKGLNRLLNASNGILGKLGGAALGQVGQISFGRVGNPYAGAAQAVGNVAASEIGAAQGVDYVGAGIGAIKDFASDASDYLRNLANGLGADDKEEKAKKSRERAERKQRDPFGDLVSDAEGRIATLKAEGAAIALVGEEALRAKYNQDLLNQARQAGIKLTPLQTLTLQDLAAEMARLDNANESRRVALDQIRSTEESIAMMGAEREAIGKTASETARLLTTQQLLNDEKFRGIQYSDQERQRIIDLAAAQAVLTEQMEKQRQELAFQRDVFDGYFGDIFDGLREGKSLWRTFADAATNAINRILDRLFDLWIDQAFQSLVTNQQGGGLFGSLFKLISSLGPAVGGVPSNLGTANNAVPFAKGGAFGSDIISQPTMFGYGNGKMGLMGEAGPEAVLPLRRGADGSLGVQMHAAANNNQPVNVNVMVQASEYFDAVVDQRATNVAAPMAARSAVAGAELAEGRIARRRRSVIP